MVEPKIKEQFKQFAIKYCGDCKGNAEASAIACGYSPRYARGNAHKLVARKDVQEYIQYINVVGVPKQKDYVATITDIQAFWSSIMNDTSAEVKDRLRASELLCKSRGGFNSSDW